MFVCVVLYLNQSQVIQAHFAYLYSNIIDLNETRDFHRIGKTDGMRNASEPNYWIKQGKRSMDPKVLPVTG